MSATLRPAVTREHATALGYPPDATQFTVDDMVVDIIDDTWHDHGGKLYGKVDLGQGLECRFAGCDRPFE
jgi:hypothetical protein